MEKIKLPRSSYEELSKIITAYGALSRPAGLNDVAQSSGVHKTQISANNAFLAFIEIIEGGNKKSITEKGKALARALEHQMEPEKRAVLKEIIDENDFLTKMVQAVRIRRGMEISQFENHIAFSSGETKSGVVRTGARAVLDILLDSSVLIEEGDKILYNKDLQKSPEISENKKSASSNFNEEKVVEKRFEIPQSNLKTGLSVNIKLSINATPNELDGLGNKIKAIIDELSKK